MQVINCGILVFIAMSRHVDKSAESNLDRQSNNLLKQVRQLTRRPEVKVRGATSIRAGDNSDHLVDEIFGFDLHGGRYQLQKNERSRNDLIFEKVPRENCLALVYMENTNLYVE